MGAGILPVTIFKNTIFFLLGKEKYNNNYWCDFGGSSNKYETIFETAIREGYEELDGLLGCKKDMENIVINNLIDIYSFDRYTTFLFYVKYEEINTLPFYFNNHRKFINENIIFNPSKGGIFEKSEIKLFTQKDLIINRKKIRPFYRKITDDLIKLKPCDINII